MDHAHLPGCVRGGGEANITTFTALSEAFLEAQAANVNHIARTVTKKPGIGVRGTLGV